MYSPVGDPCSTGIFAPCEPNKQPLRALRCLGVWHEHGGTQGSAGFLPRPPPRRELRVLPTQQEGEGLSRRLARPGRSCAGCRSTPESKGEFN